jgi:hypothetical protein
MSRPTFPECQLPTSLVRTSQRPRYVVSASKVPAVVDERVEPHLVRSRTKYPCFCSLLPGPPGTCLVKVPLPGDGD